MRYDDKNINDWMVIVIYIFYNNLGMTVRLYKFMFGQVINVTCILYNNICIRF